MYALGGVGAALTVAGLLAVLALSGPVGVVLAPVLAAGGLGAAVKFGVPRPLLKGLCIAGLVALVLGAVVAWWVHTWTFGSWMS
jgi:hypothetical protein